MVRGGTPRIVFHFFTRLSNFYCRKWLEKGQSLWLIFFLFLGISSLKRYLGLVIYSFGDSWFRWGTRYKFLKLGKHLLGLHELIKNIWFLNSGSQNHNQSWCTRFNPFVSAKHFWSNLNQQKWWWKRAQHKFQSILQRTYSITDRFFGGRKPPETGNNWPKTGLPFHQHHIPMCHQIKQTSPYSSASLEEMRKGYARVFPQKKRESCVKMVAICAHNGDRKTI